MSSTETYTMIKLSPLAALILALASAAPAYAHAVPPDCGDAPREQWMSEDAIKARGRALLYDVGAVRVEGGCYELQSVNAAKIKLYLHPVTGAVVTLEDRD
jgi:hypothetical protein